MLFVKTETFMPIKRVITILLTASIFMLEAICGPVGKTLETYIQPDGTGFQVRVTGDEWMRLRMTSDGCAIVREESGWWCYGIYDSNGNISSTGCRVGEPVAHDILSASRAIPYRALAEKASRRRRTILADQADLAQATRSSAALTRSGGEKVCRRAIALLVEFSDIKFQHTREAFENMLNEPRYKGTGSAKDYYEDQFGEGWEFIFDVSDIITLTRPVKYYGENTEGNEDIRPWEMVREACQEAYKEQNIDFSLYDQDNDGKVDNVYIFYAGKSESENTSQTELIWPHQYYIYSGTPGISLVFDGKRIDRYACSAEMSGERSFTGIGSFCHEFGHTLGLVDLYDTDYDEDGGWAAGVWKKTSLMDGGNYNNKSATPPNFNCIERELLGLSEPVIIEEGNSYTLDPIHENGTFCRLESGTPGEYYLFECRIDEGWDRYIGGKGMLVYHIDKKATDIIGGLSYTRWRANTVNADHSCQCADLIEADGRSDLIVSYDDFQKSLQGIFFPQNNATAITPGGTPGLTYRYGKDPQISISGIRNEGRSIVFKAVNSTAVEEVPRVINVSFTAFPDAVLISFEKSSSEAQCTPSVRWRKSGSEEEYRDACPVVSESGVYCCKIDGLESGNVSYETQIRFVSEDSIGDSYRLSFMTKRSPAVSWPYIYAGSGWSAEQGIALHVVNAEGTVSWEYNGKALDPGCFIFHPSEDGILKAVVENRDGSHDTIIKEIHLTR